MSKVLISGNNLMFNPMLAAKIGLNESIVLQQIHYWLKNNHKKNRNLYNGKYWAYNTYKEWQDQFPFWSLSTIKRTFQSLENKHLLLSARFNKLGIDRTKWYTINYERLKLTFPLAQFEPLDELKLTPPIPETTIPKTTPEISYNDNGSFADSKDQQSFDEEIYDFMRQYTFEIYPRYKGREHPRLKNKQLQKIHDLLLSFSHEQSLSTEELCLMAESFIENVHDSDHNLNHFATEGILQNRIYDAGLL